MEFVVIDFETANEKLVSVCQVGIAHFKDEKIIDKYVTLVNPQDEFSSINSSIHGIRENHVKNAPVFQDVYKDIYAMLNDKIVVSHTHFDRAVLHRIADNYDLDLPKVSWLDSAKVVRRTWAKYARKGYGLSNVTKDLDIEFKHHDALEDAIAAGKVLLRASEVSGVSVEGWLQKTKTSITPNVKIGEVGSPDGVFYGECVVFTGALSMSRRKAAEIAAQIGCNVGGAVTKKTTILIVGDQDIERLKPGASKSSKHLRAESLILEGYDIKILTESDFLNMASK